MRRILLASVAIVLAFAVPGIASSGLPKVLTQNTYKEYSGGKWLAVRPFLIMCIDCQAGKAANFGRGTVAHPEGQFFAGSSTSVEHAKPLVWTSYTATRATARGVYWLECHGCFGHRGDVFRPAPTALTFTNPRNGRFSRMSFTYSWRGASHTVQKTVRRQCTNGTCNWVYSPLAGSNP